MSRPAYMEVETVHAMIAARKKEEAAQRAAEAKRPKFNAETRKRIFEELIDGIAFLGLFVCYALLIICFG